MNRDGSGARLLTGALDRNAFSPRWAQDGSGVYFLSADHGNTGLYFITLDGSLRKLAGNVGSGTSAYGGGTSFSVAKNGSFAITYSRPNVPGDVAAGDGGAKAPKVITAVNEGLLTGRTLGEVEEISYESSRGHRKI
jgi:dipeptidyl aminopeptidase/acylaminoacyl peptidase